MKHTYIQSTIFLLVLSLSMLTHANEGFDQQRPEGVTDKQWNSLKAAVQEAKITASDRAFGDSFGVSVSLFGERALIGAYRDGDNNGVQSGSAYIFDFNGNNWVQTSKLIATDGTSNDLFGNSVSLSGDRALIGAYRDDNVGTESGSAYVFDFDGSKWVQTSKLIATDGFGTWFGYSVSLVGDRALIGAQRNNDNGTHSGSAYVFDFDGSNWIQTSKLNANDGAMGDLFGSSVSLLDDRALISAISNENNGINSGSAYVFDYDGSNWEQSNKLIADDAAAGDVFGISVSLSGNRALIGAYSDDDNGSASGSAYVFDFDGNNWLQTSKLTANDGAFADHFGISVSLSGDRALISSIYNDNNGISSGSAYVFEFDGLNWAQTSKLMAADGTAEDEFGISVSLVGDRALIGAWQDDVNFGNSGSAYIFNLDLILKNGFE